MQIRYWDAITKSYVTHDGVVIRCGLGYSAGPTFGILYHLSDGRFLGGVIHSDRGDLMTEIQYAKTARDAMPARWR